MYKKITTFVLSIVATVAYGGDLFEGGALSLTKAGSLIRADDLVGKYAIYSGGIGWRFENGKVGQSTGGLSPISMGQIQMSYWEAGKFVAHQNIVANLTSGGNSYWNGSPCSGEHMIKSDRPKGQNDDCLTVDPVLIPVGANSILVASIKVTQSGSSGRFLVTELGISFDALGFPGTGMSDWNKFAIAANRNKVALIEKLSKWAEKYRDGAFVQMGYSKIDNPYREVPEIRTLFASNDFAKSAVGSGPALNLDNVDSLGGRTQAQIEDELWDSIKGSTSSLMFEAYILNYPNGRYVSVAKVKIATLNNFGKSEGRYADVGTAEVLDKQLSLTWTKQDSQKDSNWFDAQRYCSSKGRAWRLPKISELQELWVSNQNNETDCGGFSCNAPRNFTLSSPIFWSSDGGGEQKILAFYLADGSISKVHPMINSSMRALCVKQ